MPADVAAAFSLNSQPKKNSGPSNTAEEIITQHIWPW